jgi:hypothetical protein
MMSDLALEAYARELDAEVDEAVRSGNDTPYHEREFTRIILDDLAEIGAVENPVILWHEQNFGGDRAKITGYSMSDDNERLTLITTIYRGTIPLHELSSDEKLDAYRQAIRFFEASCKGQYQTIDPSLDDVRDFSRKIYEARDSIEVLRVVLISDQMTGLGHADIKGVLDDTRLVIDQYGVERLYRLLKKGLSRDDITIDILRELHLPLPCLKVSAEGMDYDAYLTAIPGSLLADVYEKYGTRLLELNVRAFLGLGSKKSVNAGLRTTILEAPMRFLAYNNGIVATVDELDLTESAPGELAIKSMRGLQIVNGGQTTASLHRAKLQDNANLGEIYVPAKIIRVGGADLNEMVSAVSRSANSQNTVQPADFSANDAFHVAVEGLANTVWLPNGHGRWFYERARGSYRAAQLAAEHVLERGLKFARETPKDRRFSKTDLAKYLNAWQGFPHLVSYGSQKNFQYFMQALKDEHAGGFIPDEKWYKHFIAKAILFRSTQDLVKKQKFPAYRAVITAYTVAGMAEKFGDAFDLDLVWQNQSISDGLSVLIQSCAVAIDKELRRSAGGRMPSEWAKKVECWDSLKEIKLADPEPLPPELRISVRSDPTIETERFDSDESLSTDRDVDSVILRVRPIFGRLDFLTREELSTRLLEALGYSASESNGHEDVENIIRACIRRCILEEGGGGYALVGRTVADYSRDDLKDQFLASLNGSGWMERNECIPRFARWLGFRRTGPNIEDAARSAINGLIRSERLEKMGSQIRRKA